MHQILVFDKNYQKQKQNKTKNILGADRLLFVEFSKIDVFLQSKISPLTLSLSGSHFTKLKSLQTYTVNGIALGLIYL